MIDEFLRERVAYYLANARVTVSSVKDSDEMCCRREQSEMTQAPYVVRLEWLLSAADRFVNPILCRHERLIVIDEQNRSDRQLTTHLNCC